MEKIRMLINRDPIEEAQSYVVSHYAEKLTLQEMARRVHLSKNYFSCLFRAKTGCTFTQYVNGLRVERSKAYLLDTDLPIGEVMLRVGFEDQSYFTKVFRRSTGLPPGRFRERQTS